MTKGVIFGVISLEHDKDRSYQKKQEADQGMGKSAGTAIK